MSDFYTNLPSFRDFSEITKAEHFHTAPEDWILVISDIRGSTKAIQEGRYREVNMVGASVFTAVMNSLPGVDIPFVFGGDGSTLLIPPNQVDAAIQSLKATQKMAQENFQFDLRVGLIPLSTLYRQNILLQIGKYEVSPQNFLAMFRGGALSKAEELVKQESPLAQLIKPDSTSSLPDLTGLTCRWEPFKSRKGLVLTLLVQARKARQQETAVYEKVLQKINQILGQEIQAANPISLENMKEKPLATDLNIELRLTSNKGVGRIFRQIQLLYKSILNYIFIEKNLRIGNFKGSRYKQELISNADHKKFDDMLRMVLDCSVDQANLIAHELETLYIQGEIFYGTHRSDEALMTCLMSDLQAGKHLHFIDGAQGGYALAATQLKGQIKSLSENEEAFEIFKSEENED